MKRLAVVALLAACSSSSRPPAGGGDAVDAGSAADAASPEAHAAGTWCAGRTEALCEDFDTPTFTSKSWSIHDTKGTIGTGLPPGGLDTTSFLSAPNAFTAKVPAVAGPGIELVQIQGGSRGVDASHVEADFAFDLRIASLGTSTRIEVARIEGVNPINFSSYGIALLVSGTAASVELTQGSGGSTTHPLATAPVIGRWSRVAFHLALERTVTGPPTTFTVAIDEAPPESLSLDRGMGVSPFLRLGLGVTGPSTPCEVAYDNVTYDAH